MDDVAKDQDVVVHHAVGHIADTYLDEAATVRRRGREGSLRPVDGASERARPRDRDPERPQREDVADERVRPDSPPRRPDRSDPSESTGAGRSGVRDHVDGHTEPEAERRLRERTSTALAFGRDRGSRPVLKTLAAARGCRGQETRLCFTPLDRRGRVSLSLRSGGVFHSRTPTEGWSPITRSMAPGRMLATASVRTPSAVASTPATRPRSLGGPVDQSVAGMSVTGSALSSTTVSEALPSTNRSRRPVLSRPMTTWS